ncbi:hypothetical protein ABPG75_010686 [Micractinium tetrahymenae]
MRSTSLGVLAVLGCLLLAAGRAQAANETTVDGLVVAPDGGRRQLLLLGLTSCTLSLGTWSGPVAGKFSVVATVMCTVLDAFIVHIPGTAATSEPAKSTAAAQPAPTAQPLAASAAFAATAALSAAAAQPLSSAAQSLPNPAQPISAAAQPFSAAAQPLAPSAKPLSPSPLSATADPTCSCYLKLDLISASGGAGCASTPLTLCLPSFRVQLDADCGITIAPPNSSWLQPGWWTPGGYVSAIWSANAADTYASLQACPTAWSGPVASASPQGPAQVRAAIEQAVEQHVYGSGYSLATTAAWDTGTLTLTTAGSCALKYGITEDSAPAAYTSQIGSTVSVLTCEPGGVLTVGTECALDTADACPAGTYGVPLTTGKLCAACPPGKAAAAGQPARVWAGYYSASSNTGQSCTAADAGSYVGAVRSSAEAGCPAGSYTALGGQGACQPCDAGSYQGSPGGTSCSTCPANSYARLPGATGCLHCVAGVAKCVAGTDPGGTCDPGLPDAPSPGYQVLALSTPGNLSATSCGLGAASLSFAQPALFGQCTLSAGSPTSLSLFVDRYCGVQIVPLGDTACSEPAAGYWPSMKLQAVYAATNRIANQFSSSSSFLLELAPVSGSSVALSYWPATTDVAEAAAVEAFDQVCTGTASVTGGQVVGLRGSPSSSCPAGSYDDSDAVDGCRPCPVGRVCAAGSTEPTACSADQYQPYLGMPDGGCLTCNASAVPRYTSDPGADYCTEPFYDAACPSGQQYDPDFQTCVPCAAGEYRTLGRDSICLPCVAKTSNGSVGLEGSTFCDACDPGTVAGIVSPNTYATCEPCADGYYRSGDSSPFNNVCKIIPQGVKEAARNSTAYARAALTSCSKGEVSYWADGQRVPADPEACKACAGDNTYAPRTGMAGCQPCRAGFYPTQSDPGLPGNDQCSPCTGSTYRPFSSSSPTCPQCTAGREVDGTRSFCLPCKQGYYMPDVLGGNNVSLAANGSTCLPCPVNRNQPRTGQTSCNLCPAGYSTQDVGNAQCDPCAAGYYSPLAATTCLAAPRGTYVSTQGAKTYTPCAPGTFSGDEGDDACDSCPPGLYANTYGSRTCKACRAGTFSKGGAVSCLPCPAGFTSAPGASSCTACRPGNFASAAGSGSCTLCPLGMQCPTMATRNPQPCPRGSFSNRQGSRLCSPCPPNTYTSETGQRNCNSCDPGYSTRGLTGQSACQPVRTTASVRAVPPQKPAQ